MKRLLVLLLVGVLVVGGILFIAKDWLIKQAFASAVETLTGFDTTVSGLRLDLLNGIVHLEGLVLLNPYEFEERVFADVPEIYLKMDLAALIKKEKIYIRELRFDVSRFNIEKNKNGVSNVSLLTSVKKTQGEQTAPAVKKQGMPFRLDRLELTLGRVSYNDRSSLVPKKLAVDAHVNHQIFEGITDAKSIINIILMKVISATPFGNLGINPIAIQKQLKTSVKSVRDFGEKIFQEAGATYVAEQTQVVGKQVWSEGKETVTQVGSVAREEITGLWGKVRSKIKTSGGQ